SPPAPYTTLFRSLRGAGDGGGVGAVVDGGAAAAARALHTGRGVRGGGAVGAGVLPARPSGVLPPRRGDRPRPRRAGRGRGRRDPGLGRRGGTAAISR